MCWGTIAASTDESPHDACIALWVFEESTIEVLPVLLPGAPVYLCMTTGPGPFELDRDLTSAQMTNQ